MNEKLVSVIVPVYNAELFLSKCINSLINQDYKKIEIILVNDGSNDNSKTICDEFSLKDSRITVVHRENKGVSSARNLGLEMCSGDFIMFIDSDDWIELNTISTLMNIQDESNYDLIMYGLSREYLELKKTTNQPFNEEIFENKNQILKALPNFIKNEKVNSLCNKLYKSEVIKNKQIFFDESLNIAEDALFNYQVFFEINTLYISEQCFYHYTVKDHPSLTKRYNPKKYEMLVFVNNYLNKISMQNKVVPELSQAVVHIRLKNIYSCFLDLFNKDCPLTQKEKKKYIKKVINKEKLTSCSQSDRNINRILVSVLSTKNSTVIYAFVCFLAKIKPYTGSAKI